MAYKINIEELKKRILETLEHGPLSSNELAEYLIEQNPIPKHRVIIFHSKVWAACRTLLKQNLIKVVGRTKSHKGAIYSKT